MIDDTIDILTKQMIETDFKNKSDNELQIIRMSKIQLYQFCIKLVKIMKQVDEMEFCSNDIEYEYIERSDKNE